MWGRVVVFFFQAEDGIRDLVRSRGLGDVYKRQLPKGADAGLLRDRDAALGDRLVAEQHVQERGFSLSLIHI